jgi:hypothetical protein
VDIGVSPQVVDPGRVGLGATASAHKDHTVINSKVLQGCHPLLPRFSACHRQQHDGRVFERAADNTSVGPELLNDGRVEPRQDAGIGLTSACLGMGGTLESMTDRLLPLMDWYNLDLIAFRCTTGATTGTKSSVGYTQATECPRHTRHYARRGRASPLVVAPSGSLRSGSVGNHVWCRFDPLAAPSHPS